MAQRWELRTEKEIFWVDRKANIKEESIRFGDGQGCL